MSEDRLTQAMQGVELLDRLDRADQQRQQQSIDNQFKAQQIGMQQLALNLESAKEARLVNEHKMVLEHQIRAEHSASAASALVAQIDTFHPNAESDLNNAMATALGNGVESQVVREIFGPKMQQITFRKNQEAQNMASTLGDEGRTLFDALRTEGGVDPVSALQLTKKSLNAKATYEWYVDYASKNGMAVDVSDTDMANMRKRVGNVPPVSVTTGNNVVSYDARKEMWDMDEVNRWAHTKVLTPEFSKRIQDELKFADDKQKAELAEVQARTLKLGVETASLADKNGVSGAAGGFVPKGTADTSTNATGFSTSTNSASTSTNRYSNVNIPQTSGTPQPGPTPLVLGVPKPSPAPTP